MDRVSLSHHTEGRNLRFGQLGASITQDRKKCPGAHSQYMYERPRAEKINKKEQHNIEVEREEPMTDHSETQCSHRRAHCT